MPYGMYVSASGAEAQSRYIEVLANNLANADTVGFKQDFPIMKARHSEAIEQGLDLPGSQSINNLGGGTAVTHSMTDYSRGTVKQTGNPTDLAIDDRDGNAFFVIKRNGEELLTRAGNFKLSSSGQLQTQDGDAVMSDEGTPITIDPEAGPYIVRQNGTIQQGDAEFTISLVKPVSLGDLAKAGQNLFKPLADTIPVEANERQVRSGYLELSSVRPIQAMTDLIKATRAYEANVRLIQHQDQMMGSLVNRVLRQS